MSDQVPSAEEQLTFLQNVQRLLDEGEFVASYKFALLLSFAALSVEQQASSDGSLFIPLDHLAERFIEIYWRQAAPFGGKGVLLQNTDKQAKVVRLLEAFRDYGATVAVARRARRWRGLVGEVRRTLSTMPLWKLQTVGTTKLPFLYNEVRDAESIVLLPGVAGCFRSLKEVIQALVQTAWLRHIQKLPKNQPIIGQGGDLAEFMFGSERGALAEIGKRLLQLQRGKCFYCQGSVQKGGEVDHFIPWARYPRDLGHNFVLAHRDCNQDKRDMLANVPHLERWVGRNDTEAESLSEMFETTHLLYDLETSARVADWCYDLVERNHGLVWAKKGLTHPLDGSWRSVLRT